MTPSDRRDASSELIASRMALRAIMQLVAEGKPIFDRSVDRRRHLAYLWIVVGSRLKNHARVLQVARTGGEFGLAIGFRHKLAYSSPEDLDLAPMWASATETPSPAAIVRLEILPGEPLEYADALARARLLPA